MRVDWDSVRTRDGVKPDAAVLDAFVTSEDIDTVYDAYCHIEHAAFYNRDLEEAALMDGAGTWGRFRHVLLPALRPALFFLAVLETTVAFQVFDVIYVMTGGGPANSSHSLILFLYDQGFRYSDHGYASAVGVILFVMTLLVALVQRVVLGRRS